LFFRAVKKISSSLLQFQHPFTQLRFTFLLKVLAMLPVSTATRERTFSTLKRVKTFLRNSSGQKRPTGIYYLLSIHSTNKVNPEQVLNQIALSKERSILLI